VWGVAREHVPLLISAVTLIATYLRVLAAAGFNSSTALRELAGVDGLGVNLMRAAFRKDGGVLTDSAADPGEQVATMALFAGAIGTFKNLPLIGRSTTPTRVRRRKWYSWPTC
jgi:hypothetical protein